MSFLSFVCAFAVCLRLHPGYNGLRFQLTARCFLRICGFQGTCADSLCNGDEGIRTLDPLLARQVLSQLSYTPEGSGGHLLSRTVPSAVPSAGRALTVVFGMRTGVTPKRIATGNFLSP